MAESVSRELILPSLRLEVPPRPSERQLSAAAQASRESWTVSTRDWVAHQVVRLAVAAVLGDRLARAAANGHEVATLADAAGLFRPHLDLSGQAFRVAVVEALNAGVPAVVDPLRESLRRVGVTGREPVRVVALGLDRLPDRAAPQFWSAERTSATLTSVVASLSSGSRDLTGLDRSQLARADALVLAGGRTTAINLATPGSKPREGSSWLQVPVSLARRHRTPGHDDRRASASEIGLRPEGWSEVFDAALDALSVAMHQIDLGGRPRGRVSPLADAVAQRLVAVKDLPAAEVVASLRDVGEFALEMFGHQVGVSDVRVVVPVLDDDLFAQLWLSDVALGGPLVSGAADLFLGSVERAQPQRGGPGGQPQRGGPAPRGGGQPQRGDQPGGRGRSGPRPGGRAEKRPDKRGEKRPEKRPERQPGQQDQKPEQRPGKLPGEQVAAPPGPASSTPPEARPDTPPQAQPAAEVTAPVMQPVTERATEPVVEPQPRAETPADQPAATPTETPAQE